jgi:hypothetical protein
MEHGERIELYVCCTCNNHALWTDYLSMCPRCGGLTADAPVVVDATREGGTVDIDSLYEKHLKRLAEDGGEWPEYTGPGR